jgi:hypothetical protein
MLLINHPYIINVSIIYLAVFDILLIYSCFITGDLKIKILFGISICICNIYLYLLYKINSNRTIEYLYNYWTNFLFKYSYIIFVLIYPLTLMIFINDQIQTNIQTKYNTFIFSLYVINFINYQLIALYMSHIAIKIIYNRYISYRQRSYNYREYIQPLINNLPITIITVPKDNICAICLSSEESNEEWTKLNCFHTYHTKCISEWILTKPNCPECRANITDSYCVECGFIISNSNV